MRSGVTTCPDWPARQVATEPASSPCPSQHGPATRSTWQTSVSVWGSGTLQSGTPHAAVTWGFPTVFYKIELKGTISMCSYAKEHFLWFKTPAFQLREKPSRLGAAGAGRRPCPGAQSSRAGTAGRTALSEVLIRAPGARAEGRAAQGGRAGGASSKPVQLTPPLFSGRGSGGV